MKDIEIYEDERDFEVEGITGSIGKYTHTEVSYPYFVIENTEDCPVQLNRLQVLPNLFGAVQDNSSASSITVYYKDKEKAIKLGKLLPRQVKAFLRLFDGNKVTGMYDKDTPLKENYLYVLSS